MNFSNISSDESIVVLLIIAILIIVPIGAAWYKKRSARERESFIRAIQATDNDTIFSLYKKALPASTDLGKSFVTGRLLPPAIYHALLINDLQKARTLLDAFARPALKNVQSGSMDLIEVNHAVDRYVLQDNSPTLADKFTGIAPLWQAVFLDIYLTLYGAPGTLPSPTSETYRAMVDKVMQNTPDNERQAKLVPGLQTYAEALRAVPFTPPSSPKLLLVGFWVSYVAVIGAAVYLVYSFSLQG